MVLTCACGCGKPARPKGRYASAACRARDWKARHNYGPQQPFVRPVRRKSRDGNGVRPYLTPHEARALVAGRVPATVAAKVAAKLKPAEPIPGQLDILTALEEPHGHTTSHPQAPAP